MTPEPVVVEVNVVQNGLFITTTSIIMCDSLSQAKQAYENQKTMASALMEWQQEDFVSEEKQGSRVITDVHLAE